MSPVEERCPEWKHRQPGPARFIVFPRNRFGRRRERVPNTALRRAVPLGVAALSGPSYPILMGGMKGITIKLPEAIARQLKEQARQSGRSVAALIRERIEAPLGHDGSVYAITDDLAGSLAGSRLPATNARPKFRRP
jgi:hypothetical protein